MQPSGEVLRFEVENNRRRRLIGTARRNQYPRPKR